MFTLFFYGATIIFITSRLCYIIILLEKPHRGDIMFEPLIIIITPITINITPIATIIILSPL